ncbi:Uncharacterized protein TPAR_02801 [Tolypocladium paradoxum]|uniref:Uncharacterized protein n=1 Tax=Tolypocladium paradoxum TaxID=94208 RepID=A0A2S4L3I2_9HYPO|nr:Uncharacterized protein TPAR_02801 [Tolypocladium paradoxum]
MENTESTKGPKRVLVSVSRKSPYWTSAWTSSEEVIRVALQLMKENNMVSLAPDDPSSYLFLAKERWDSQTYLVFDIFHDTYDPDNAHLPGQNDLSVISVFLHQKESVSDAGKMLENKVNKDLRSLHNSTGLGSRPPFTVDHADGMWPTYLNPRIQGRVVTS